MRLFIPQFISYQIQAPRPLTKTLRKGCATCRSPVEKPVVVVWSSVSTRHYLLAKKTELDYIYIYGPITKVATKSLDNILGQFADGESLIQYLLGFARFRLVRYNFFIRDAFITKNLEPHSGRGFLFVSPSRPTFFGVRSSLLSFSE